MNAGNKTMLIGIENELGMIHKTCESYALGDSDQEVLLAWKRELLATKVMVHAVMKDRAQALSVAKASFLADPSWIFTFLRCGALATGRRVRTILRTWRQSAKAK
jgi:hypothetical protein